MSRLPSSTKRPRWASRPRLADWAGPVRELRTTSTPRPPVRSRTSSAKSRVRESMTWATPRPRRQSRLASLPAVAQTSAPHACARLSAASPVPPLAEWRSTFSPGRSRARCRREYQAVR